MSNAKECEYIDQNLRDFVIPPEFNSVIFENCTIQKLTIPSYVTYGVQFESCTVHAWGEVITETIVIFGGQYAPLPELPITTELFITDTDCFKYYPLLIPDCVMYHDMLVWDDETLPPECGDVNYITNNMRQGELGNCSKCGTPNSIPVIIIEPRPCIAVDCEGGGEQFGYDHRDVRYTSQYAYGRNGWLCTKN